LNIECGKDEFVDGQTQLIFGVTNSLTDSFA